MSSLNCRVTSVPFLEILADYAESSANPTVFRTRPTPNRFTQENVRSAFQFFEGHSSEVQERPVVFSRTNSVEFIIPEEYSRRAQGQQAC